ncbi:MAG: MucB/RseB C-terminal domain-containing protein [Janthinobacterium lividum]
MLPSLLFATNLARAAATAGAATTASITSTPVSKPTDVANDTSGGGSDSREFVAWLNQIHRAALTLTYSGTFVYQHGNAVQSSRILHYVDRAGTEFERLESLDGEPRRVLRRDDQLVTVLPAAHTLIIDKRQNKDSFPALMTVNARQLLAVYTPKFLADDRMAGNDCRVAQLTPNDAYRFAYKLWADKRTGLLLRAQTIDAQGAVLEQIAFSQISVGDSAEAQKNPVQAELNATAGWKTIRSPIEPANLEQQGWTLQPPVAGFQKIGELRRLMAARERGDPPVAVDQAVFSDGLTAISVFVEPQGKSDRKEGTASSGATHILVTRHGDFIVTLVGEVPPETLQQFASAIEYKPGKSTPSH